MRHFLLERQVLASEAREAFPLQVADAAGLAPGELVAVVDAARDYFVCEVVGSDGPEPIVRIAQRHGSGAGAGAGAAGPRVVLAAGVLSDGKSDEVVRAATELGVSGLVPLLCRRSSPSALAAADEVAARWRDVAADAALHAGLPAPEVASPRDIAGACDLFAQAAAVLLCWEEAPGHASLAAAAQRARRRLAQGGDEAFVAVVVGPEGGFADDEVEAMLGSNPHASLATLGPTILRAQTAAVLATTLALYELGGLGNIAHGEAGA